MDRARTETDRKLNKMESQIGRIYESSPALKRIEREYAEYMKMVQKKTEPAYKAYLDADYESKADLKKAYTDEVRALTIDSKDYNKLIKKFTDVMAQVNQEALSVVNHSMSEIYALNYNQVADECKRVGIEVNG